MTGNGTVAGVETVDVDITDDMEQELSCMGAGSEDDQEITEGVSL